MTAKDIRTSVLNALAQIAPEIPIDDVQDDWDLRDEFDLDSMDFLKLVQTLHASTGVEIPETDYARVTTVSEAVEYITNRL